MVFAFVNVKFVRIDSAVNSVFQLGEMYTYCIIRFVQSFDYLTETAAPKRKCSQEKI